MSAVRSREGGTGEGALVDPEAITGRERYQLMTSLIVPRPIGWISTVSPEGAPNLAPFSYFAALSASPMLVGVSIGSRRGAVKDTLRNIVETGEFCVNVVTEQHLDAMNESAGDHAPEVDEFAVVGLQAVRGSVVGAPYVVGCPAVLECRLHRRLELDDAGGELVIGRVVGVRLGADLTFVPGTLSVDPASLLPVGRLGGDLYALPGEIRALPRPVVGGAGAERTGG